MTTRTRIKLVWAFVGMCLLGMLIGAYLKEGNVVNASLASASAVVIMYIGGKSLNNNQQIKKGDYTP